MSEAFICSKSGIHPLSDSKVNSAARKMQTDRQMAHYYNIVDTIKAKQKSLVCTIMECKCC